MRHARPASGQAVPGGVVFEVLGAEEPLVVVLVRVVPRRVAGHRHAAHRRLELRGDVGAPVPGRTVDPVGSRLARCRQPTVHVTWQPSGVVPQVVLLAVERSAGRQHRQAAVAAGIVRLEVEGPAERLVGPRADVGGPLGYQGTAEVGGVDVAVRLRAAAVVRVAVRHAVHGDAKLLLVEVHFESAHRDRRRPVVEAERVPLLHRYPGQAVDHRQNAGERRLRALHVLGRHRVREDHVASRHDRDLLEARGPGALRVVCGGRDGADGCTPKGAPQMAIDWLPMASHAMILTESLVPGVERL